MAGDGSYGICEECDTRVGKAAMRTHLRKCLLGSSGAARTPTVLVRVQARGEPMFWLDVAGSPEATLKALDGLLRREWLECCGHLSEFTNRQDRTIGMNRRVGEVLGSPGDRLDYVYDFGSSTELVVTHAGVVGAAPMKGVRAVARNEAPSWQCGECEQPATAVCAADDAGFCCEAHASDHRCGEEMLLPIVNSPRMGVCAYAG